MSSVYLDPSQVQQETKERNPVPSRARHAGYNTGGSCSVPAPGREAWFGSNSPSFDTFSQLKSIAHIASLKMRGEWSKVHNKSPMKCTDYKIIPPGKTQEWISDCDIQRKQQFLCRCEMWSIVPPNHLFYTRFDVQIIAGSTTVLLHLSQLTSETLLISSSRL